MPIVEQLNQDLKTAMLARESATVDALKTLKTALQYSCTPPSAEAVASMSDEAVIAVFQKEAKKRQESADLYGKAGAQDKADKELAEKALIQKYLPEQLSEDEVRTLVDAAITAITDSGAELGKQHMGQLIGTVKAASKGQADGALVARLVQERLSTV